MGSYVTESSRVLPLAVRVDVAVIGGSTGAARAAVAAAEGGASVFLAAPRPYLGDDLCATLRLRPRGSLPDDPLAKRLFPDGGETTPLRIKKALDDALIEAGAEFLFGCYATDVLRDDRGMVCGFAMANRTGRQAVVAKVIIDATDRAAFARMAGAEAVPWPDGELDFSRVVIVDDGSERGAAVEHPLRLRVPEPTFSVFAEAEQQARDLTCSPGQLRAAESLFQVPPDPIVCRCRAAARDACQDPPLDHFRPSRLDRLYILSGCADLPVAERARLLDPAGLLRAASRIGAAAAEESKGIPDPAGVRVTGDARPGEVAGDVRELLVGLRLNGTREDGIVSPSRRVPVLGDFDVVVIGGGTAGAAAAIGATRRNVRVLVVEYQEGLGGMGTVGLIGKPYHGRKAGFGAEVPFPGPSFTLDDKMQWFRRQIRTAGGVLWFGAFGCGALVEGRRLRGVVVATPLGRGVVLGRVVVDATGNADVAAAAGVRVAFGGEDTGAIALQGTGLPRRPLRGSCQNSDYLLADESDVVDARAALVGARRAMLESAYDSGSLIQSRERRRVLGDHVLRYIDQIAGRTYPDSIALSESDYDAHGYPVDDFFALMPHDATSLKAKHPAPGGLSYTPYRCLLPRGIDGLLVAGVGISMERDASALMRMQYDILNQGYAAGVAAAMAASLGGMTRTIDVRTLQRHLVEKGILPAEVLDHRDSFPLPPETVRRAVDEFADADRPTASRALAILLGQREEALPWVRAAFKQAAGSAKLTLAKLLGFWGAADVAPVLLDALDRVAAWDTKVLQGLMAEYAHLPTPVDALVLALGRSGNPFAVPAVLRLLDWLDEDTPLSHHRAVAAALESLHAPSAAEPLARLLKKPGMSGHAMRTIEPLHNEDVPRRRREASLREIILAQALYRCGDWEQTGETILRKYRQDVRALFARHAATVLSAKRRFNTS